MRKYITIDGGTTNTRVGLVCGEEITVLRCPIGAGSRNPEGYKAAIRDAIAGLCENQNDIECILAAGMITSELGLFKLDHIEAPAGIDELGAGMKRVMLPEISSLPFFFIPGVKTTGTLEKTDIMRGEECEVFGLPKVRDNALYVLPGSHSKLIKLQGGRITDFSTMLTGEMAAALSGGTILRDAVELSVDSTDKKYLLDGYSYARQHGINETLFKVRILKNLMGADKKEVYSFFLGAVLEGEIRAILHSAADTVVIAGKRQLREATAEILRTACDKKIITVDNHAVDRSTFLGMIKIYEAKKQA